MHTSTIVRTLALLAHDPSTRDDLARYLERAGYHVRVVDRPAGKYTFLVWLADRDAARDEGAIATSLDEWLAAVEQRRAVLVTRRPAAFVEVARARPGRLTVLPAPVFAWDVVDALQAGKAGR